MFWTPSRKVNLLWSPISSLHNRADSSAGKMSPKGMITKTIKLDQVVEEGFKALVEDKENQVKILVDVGAGI